MRAISLSRSALVFWEDIVFVEAAVLAEPTTKDLAPLLTVVLDDFPATLKLDLDSRRGVLQSRARAHVADTLLDDTLRSLFYDVTNLVGQDRSLPAFTTLFNSHVGDVVRHALKRQIEVSAGIAEKLALKLFPDDLRAKYTGLLAPLIQNGNAVVEEVRAKALSRVGARLDVQAWKQEVNATRLTVYGQLVAIAAKTGRKKAWAEGFFPRVAAIDSEEAGDEAGDVADTEAAKPE